jgi:hypothetical protein
MADNLPCGHPATSLIVIDGVEICHECDNRLYWDFWQILNAPIDLLYAWGDPRNDGRYTHE